jgi:dephospho-CoA kinase
MKAEERLAELRRAGLPAVFYMAALLVEAGVTSRVDEIWVVYVDRETQVARLMERDGYSREGALGRIAAQMPIEEKKKLGDVVIDNRGTPDETEQQVKEIWEREFGTTVKDEG